MVTPATAPVATPVETWDNLTTGIATSVANDLASIKCAEVTFTQTSAAGTYTGSVSVPAGSTIIDIQVRSTVLWNAGTSSTMKVGDTDDDGWYTGIDLQATDLVVGEVIRFGSTGGKEGVYIVVATGAQNASYSASARLVTGIITTVGTGTAGRTRMLVLFTSPPTTTAATKV